VSRAHYASKYARYNAVILAAINHAVSLVFLALRIVLGLFLIEAHANYHVLRLVIGYHARKDALRCSDVVINARQYVAKNAQKSSSVKVAQRNRF